MKLPKIFHLLIILIASFPISFGQEKPEAVLSDEMGKPCSENLMARYDGYVVALLQNDPTATGYFVFYGDSLAEGRNLNYITYLTKIYPAFRRLDTSRIKLVRGANQAKMKIQFWLVPAGANPPKPEKEFVGMKITSTTLFDKNWADFNRESGELDIYSDGFLDLGCEFSPNVREFANTLLSNPELTGYLIVYTKFGKGLKYGNRIASFAVIDLMNNYKIPRNRLKTFYGGNREKPEIELWFLPKGDKPPIPNPDSKPKK